MRLPVRQALSIHLIGRNMFRFRTFQLGSCVAFFVWSWGGISIREKSQEDLRRRSRRLVEIQQRASKSTIWGLAPLLSLLQVGKLNRVSLRLIHFSNAASPMAHQLIHRLNSSCYIALLDFRQGIFRKTDPVSGDNETELRSLKDSRLYWL